MNLQRPRFWIQYSRWQLICIVIKILYKIQFDEVWWVLVLDVEHLLVDFFGGHSSSEHGWSSQVSSVLWIFEVHIRETKVHLLNMNFLLFHQKVKVRITQILYIFIKYELLPFGEIKESSYLRDEPSFLEYELRRSKELRILDCFSHVQRKNVHQRSRRANAQRPEQELIILRRIEFYIIFLLLYKSTVISNIVPTIPRCHRWRGRSDGRERWSNGAKQEIPSHGNIIH